MVSAAVNPLAPMMIPTINGANPPTPRPRSATLPHAGTAAAAIPSA
jgi:hypothetical protein